MATEVNGSAENEENYCGDRGELPVSLNGFVLIVNILCSFTGIFGNILIGFAVLKNMRLQTLANYFILSLAFADLFVCAITQPIFAISNIFLIHHQCINSITIAFKLSASLSCMASLLNLTALSIDRLITVKYPLQKRTILSKKRGFLVIMATWSLSLAYMVLSCILHGKLSWVIITLGYFIVCYITMITTHCHMYIVSNRFVKRRKQHARRQSCFAMMAYTRDREAAKTVVIIMAVLTLTWAPYGCAIAYTALKGVVLKRSISYPLLTLGFVNSSINPVLYSWRNKEFRTTFWQLLRCQDPNMIRRESLSSLYIRRPRMSCKLSSSTLNELNAAQLLDSTTGTKENRNSLTPCFIVTEPVQCSP